MKRYQIQRIITPTVDYEVGEVLIINAVSYPIESIELAEDKQSFSVFAKESVLLATVYTFNTPFEVHFDPAYEEQFANVRAGGVLL